MSDTTQPEDFKIGLALAGAISAGAYTAGVIDFLVQALEAWEAARTKDGVRQANVAQHRAGIKVVTGASAGAITGALGVVAMARRHAATFLSAAEEADSYRQPGRTYQTVRCVLPSLYETWVRRPRLVAETAGQIDLLSLEDLQPQPGQNRAVGSALNAELLEQIKRAALDGPAQKQDAAPRPYLAEPLHVYMTVSNLRGIPYQVPFGTGVYGMQTHGDRVHYTVHGVGTWSCPSSTWLDSDPSMPLQAADLPDVKGAQLPGPWDDYGTAALASAAFPIGLASRRIAAPFTQYVKRMYPMDVPAAFIQPKWPQLPGDGQSFTFLNMDGGLINNNPFDYAEYALLGSRSERLRQAGAENGRDTSAAVVMVAPFPEPPTFLPEGQPQAELVSLVRALLPTLMTQVRFKPSELAEAIDPKNYSRYLVAPHRSLNGEPQRYAIACGALGGFGGFLDEGFRAHDFQLGRRNCQQFLSKQFKLPSGAKAVSDPAGDARSGPAGATPAEVPIIPLCGDAMLEVALPRWPQMTEADLEVLMDRVVVRLKAVLPILVETQTSSKALRSLGKFGMFVGRTKIVDFIRFSILSDLVRRNQIEGWDLGPAGFLESDDDVRSILAELASPSFDFRSVGGIATALHLPETTVAAVLVKLCGAPGKLQVETAPDDPGLFRLVLRRPTGVWSLPGFSTLGGMIDPPSNDRPKTQTRAMAR